MKAKPGVQDRFKESLQKFFEAVNRQARDREAGILPDLESYVDIRRDTSGCKPVFDLIEYAADIELPEYVVSHPIIKALNQGTNDLVTWSNVSQIYISLIGRLSSLKSFCSFFHLIKSSNHRIFSPTMLNKPAETRTI